jgi:hypothetical protein
MIFEARSNLQKLTDPWVYTPLLIQAARVPEPLERLKLTVAWFVAGMRHTFDTWRKPFNPVLGETWQSITKSGCEAFLEQVSHHPPIAAYTMRGDGFHMFGTAELHIQARLPSHCVTVHAIPFFCWPGTSLVHQPGTSQILFAYAVHPLEQGSNSRLSSEAHANDACDHLG